jgi:F0F1-type ATP synthase assembly protein I
MGIAMVLMGLGGYLLGAYIDQTLNISPWGAIIGLLLGTGVGLWDLYRVAMRIMQAQPAPPPNRYEENSTADRDAEGDRDENHELP